MIPFYLKAFKDPVPGEVFSHKGKDYLLKETEYSDCTSCAFFRERCSVPKHAPRCFRLHFDDLSYVFVEK